MVTIFAAACSAGESNAGGGESAVEVGDSAVSIAADGDASSSVQESETAEGSLQPEAADPEPAEEEADPEPAEGSESSTQTAPADLTNEDIESLDSWIASYRSTQNEVVDREVAVAALREFMTDEEWARTPAGFADVQIRRETSGFTAEVAEHPTLGSVVILRDCLYEYYSSITPDEPSSIAEEVFVLEPSDSGWLIVERSFGEKDCPSFDG